MITLCMDTSSRFLVLALLKDDKVISSIQKDCWKRQSEEIFPCLIQIMKDNDLQPEQINEVVISKGPGSYTGVRIAMTIAKVFCSAMNIPLYTVGTLQLFAGLEHCRVVLDARGKRVYTAVLKDGDYLENPNIQTIEELQNKHEDLILIGDAHLFEKDDVIPDLSERFADLRSKWEKAENADLVTPEYLKSNSAYLVK